MKPGLRLAAARLIVSALSFCAAFAPLEAADPVAATTSGGVSVSSDPAGASVYIDGERVGETPVRVEPLAAGTHRLRIVKDGYLENARMITTTTGPSANVRVKLTARRATDASVSTTQTSQGGASSSSTFLHNPIFLVGYAAAGAGAAVALTKNNVPPLPGTFTVAPESPALSGVAGITTFTFTATGATDYDEDELTYKWDFGDGTTAATQVAAHIFASLGTYTVTLAVSDADHTVSAGSTAITVRPPLTGTWVNALDPIFSCPIAVALTHTSNRVTGTVNFGGGCAGSATLTGTVQGINATYPSTYPATVTWQTGTYSISYGGEAFTGLTLTFTGQTNQSGSTMAGPLAESLAGTPSPPATTNFIKQ